MSGCTPDYRLRPVVDADRPLIATIFADGRAADYARWGLSPEQLEALVQHQSAAQWLHYQSHYPASVHSLICVGDTAVGRVWLDQGEDALRLLDLTVLSAWRGRGIGGRILDGLKADARRSGRSIGIWLSDSEDKTWWARRGFEPQEQRDFHQRWDWTPAGDQSPVGIR